MKQRVRGKRRRRSRKTADPLFLALDTRNYGHTVHCVATSQNVHLIDTDVLRKKKMALIFQTTLR